MKYILFSTLFAVFLSLCITNCAKENYRHPTDPHANDYANNYAKSGANSYANDYANDERTNTRNDEQAQRFDVSEIRELAEQADSANDAIHARITKEYRMRQRQTTNNTQVSICDSITQLKVQ